MEGNGSNSRRRLQRAAAHVVAKGAVAACAIVATVGAALAVEVIKVQTMAPNAPPAPAVADEATPEEVVVEEKHEGPRMWRVTRGDHTLWILGTITPLPRKMTWQSDSVETL